MEALYSKLYNKYTNIKTKKFSELDQLNVDQELKFVSYVSAAEDLISHLKNENDKMSAEINDLRSEVASTRDSMDEKCVEYQRLLMEENQKNIALREEVERVQKLQQEGRFDNSEDVENNHQLTTPVGTNVVSKKLQNGSVRKHRRLSGSETEKGKKSPPVGAQDDASVRESSNNLCTTTGSGGDLENDWRPECCRRITDGSVVIIGSVNGSGLANCLFQALNENLVGMKLSALNQSEGLSVSALHQSTGFSFSLTWITEAGREDAELMYRVQSLGTFERVAPEWMREVLMFSTSMLPVFFERVARVIKLHP